MVGFWDSHYWLFTGRDWDQDKENIPCNLGFCDHNHIGFADERKLPETKMSNWARTVLIGAMLLIVSAIPIMLFCEWKGWLD